MHEICKHKSESNDCSDKISDLNTCDSKAKQWLEGDPKKYVLETIENSKKGSWQCPCSVKQVKDLQVSWKLDSDITVFLEKRYCTEL